MNKHKLSFAEITILEDDMAEVVIDEGILMDQDMVDEYHEFLLNTMKAPFGLIVNKLNSYSYSFEAQKNIANLEEIAAMAVITYNDASAIATRTLIQINNMFQNKDWNVLMFDNRDHGLSWLHRQLNKT